MSPTHCKCALEMKSFLDAHSGAQPTIDTSLDKCRSELYEFNCKRLDDIIDYIIMCGQQNIALRGHCDSGNDSSNKGNLKAILAFRSLGDKVLNTYLQEGRRNAQYTSRMTQNEITVGREI